MNSVWPALILKEDPEGRKDAPKVSVRDGWRYRITGQLR
jgi:hypothetical protein